MYQTTTPTDHQVKRAMDAACSSPGQTQVALSLVGGDSAAREVISRASAYQIFSGAPDTLKEIAARIAGGDVAKMGEHLRRVALTSIARHEREAGAVLAEESRSRARLGGRR
jgi:hypothetical protein